ncbi:MAG: ABC transporter substrate-binding protein [Alphaproteobacteria bacterium]
MSTRRAFVAGLAALAFTAATPAQAKVEAEARQFIEQLAQSTVDVVADRDASPATRTERLSHLLNRGFDTEVISRFVLGRHWRDASESERREFVALFHDYTVASYARRFEAYAGHRLEVTDARDQGGERGRIKVLVSSQLLRPTGAPVKVDWRVRQTAEGWRIYDVVVEGVSMVLTQRSEFSSVILRGGSIQGLLDQLRARTAQLSAANTLRAS